MPRVTSSYVPKYRFHRPSGQARVTIECRDFWLGPWKSKASRVEYDRVINEWLAAGRRLPVEDQAAGLAVVELIAAYRKFARSYYRKDGKITREAGCIDEALRHLKRLYGRDQVADFGPLKLKAVRESMLSDKLTRIYINKQTGRIVRMFKWGVGEEMVPAPVYQALAAVTGLRKGRCKARESEPVLPVPEADVQAMRVELIGPVNAPGRDGPTNGMYALQKALKNKIKEDGIDWLTIKPLPVSEGALPWFWHWDDRRYAAWWNSQGLPFVQGPNMLFTNSATPRIDAEECALLDAKNCRAMFCHSKWYKELIEKHKGPENKSPVITWPYPIDPMPGGPLPAEYDLLIYAKNGHRPGLLEHLAELYPRHIQFHYGQYKRQDLIEAARHSRACAYLASDDHGPLALQEILLAGCPTVGVQTGASLMKHGETGAVVDRLPPGKQCTSDDDDVTSLGAFLQAIEQAQTMSRDTIRQHAAEEFDTSRVVDNIIVVTLANTRILTVSGVVVAANSQ